MIPFETIRKTTADKITLDTVVLVHKAMEPYSGWGCHDHIAWIGELTGLNVVDMILSVDKGRLLMTDEECSAVWLLSRDHWRTTARLIYQDFP